MNKNDFTRAPNGRFLPGIAQRDVDALTPEHKERLREAARMRADMDYRAISINGVVYPNLTRASKEHQVAAATLRRYAKSDKAIYKHVFFVDQQEY